MSRPYRVRLAELHALADNAGDACVLWPYAIDTRGYPNVWIDGKVRTGHRHVLQRATGIEGEGLDARHLCDVRHCVNPKHMEWGTRTQNMQEKRRVGRYGKKLTEDQARAVLALKGVLRQVEIARRFDISQSSVCAIHRRRAWPDLEPQS